MSEKQGSVSFLNKESVGDVEKCPVDGEVCEGTEVLYNTTHEELSLFLTFPTILYFCYNNVLKINLLKRIPKF